MHKGKRKFDIWLNNYILNDQYFGQCPSLQATHPPPKKSENGSISILR
jgi:hypothetical protein